MRIRRRLVSSAAAAALVAAGLALVAAPGEAAAPFSSCTSGSPDRQAVFARAATATGVPQPVLLAVSYMESRWDDHGGSPSTSGGYGPMHLVDPRLTGTDPRAAERGEPGGAGAGVASGPLQDAARLTGLSERALRTDPVANICGGAALLAAYQKHLAPGQTDAAAPAAWTGAVARYSGSADQGAATRFVGQVFTTLRTGEARTTDDGQRVRLAAHPAARPDQAEIRRMDLVTSGGTGHLDCPAGLGCEYVEAPYKWNNTANPGAYGNHDLADRPHGALKIDYIVIHDTEASWDTTLKLVQDPTYLAWNYSIRSSDGQVAQHLDPKDVGWHAGNWYVNMHAIGIEHEGYAAQGGTWFTESMYQTSATLVRYLANEYHVPLDRAHIIGHDQVPGVDPAHVAGMHWDPGPYWDWEHYFDLLGAPIQAAARPTPGLVAVAPGFEGNANPVTGCGSTACDTANTNFVYLHTAPSESAPLVKDPGLHTDGSNSTTGVSDMGARAAAGQKLVVAQRQGDWLGVWYLGDIAWLHSPADHPTVVPASGQVVVPRGAAAVPVYGRAYPEASAYPAAIPVQTLAPLQYTLKPGQAYVLADRTVPTDYYYAKTYNCAYVAMDCTDVVGQDRYYEVWVGHRMMYVRAADVWVRDRP
ncbi:MAG: N-acetylmuramoyl-L-alanine amidase [Nocardioidaceae bacterium]